MIVTPRNEAAGCFDDTINRRIDLADVVTLLDTM